MDTNLRSACLRRLNSFQQRHPVRACGHAGRSTRSNEMARPGRLELPTLCLEGRRSIQLSYGRILGNSCDSTALATLIRVRLLPKFLEHLEQLRRLGPRSRHQLAREPTRHSAQSQTTELANFDNDQGHIVGKRAMPPGSHAIEDRLPHFRQWKLCGIEN